MKNLFLSSFLAIFTLLLIERCANPVTPTGGPRDTIPPTLLESKPEIGQLNFDDNSITLTFDEFISADQLLNNLIITPNQDIKFTSFVKKTTVVIKLDQDLTDSTTYTFNFFNGITDITERNPAENLIIPFSTGPFIDSLQVSGRILDLWTAKEQEEIVVGLYPYTDTLDFVATKPTYFVKTDDRGNFRLQNLKEARYELLAFNDLNSNLLLDPNEEAHAFGDSTIQLSQDIDSVQLQVVLINPFPPSLISARALADFFQVRYDKVITSYDINPTDTTYQTYSRLEEDLSAIKFYSHPDYPDSLQIIITAMDSIKNETRDTLFIKFNESKRRKESFTSDFPKRPVRTSVDTLKATIEFNKPILEYQLNQLTVNADTVLDIPINPNITWNTNYTQAKLTIPFNWNDYQDTVRAALNNIITDTTIIVDELTINQTSLSIPSSSFTSIENDTTDIIEIPFVLKTDLPSGILRYNLNISDSSFFVHLIDEKYQTIRVQKNQANGVFTQLPAGTYGIRILVDSNGDGKWQNANLNQKIQHEPVFVYDQFTELRSNWDITVGPINTSY